MSRLRIGLIVGTLLFASAVPVLAQQGTAEIAGKVTDQQGAVLPGVAIVVTNEETGILREMIASEEGTYLASQLAPGRYKVGQAARLSDNGTEWLDSAGGNHAHHQPDAGSGGD